MALDWKESAEDQASFGMTKKDPLTVLHGAGHVEARKAAVPPHLQKLCTKLSPLHLSGSVNTVKPSFPARASKTGLAETGNGSSVLIPVEGKWIICKLLFLMHQVQQLCCLCVPPPPDFTWLHRETRASSWWAVKSETDASYQLRVTERKQLSKKRIRAGLNDWNAGTDRTAGGDWEVCLADLPESFCLVARHQSVSQRCNSDSVARREGCGSSI